MIVTKGLKTARLLQQSRRSFIEAFGLKTVLSQAEIDARVDPATKAYRYVVNQKEHLGIPYDD